MVHLGPKFFSLARSCGLQLTHVFGPCGQRIVCRLMLPEMHNVLLHLALLTVGTNSLVVGTVPFTVPLYVHRSYVDGSSSVVFIIDTTHSLTVSRAVYQPSH